MFKQSVVWILSALHNVAVTNRYFVWIATFLLLVVVLILITPLFLHPQLIPIHSSVALKTDPWPFAAHTL